MLLIGGHDLAATGNFAVEEIGFATVVTIPSFATEGFESAVSVLGFAMEAFASVAEVPLSEF